MKCYKCKEGIVSTLVNNLTIYETCELCNGTTKVVNTNDVEYENLIQKYSIIVKKDLFIEPNLEITQDRLDIIHEKRKESKERLFGKLNDKK